MSKRIMTRAAPWIVGLVAGALVAGCAEDGDPEGAAALWERIHAEGYRTWERAPGYPTLQPSTAPHGGEVEIFVNPVVAAALAGGPAAAWPEGSVIAKDGFDGGSPSIVAAMEKRADGWFWAEWDGGGELLASGHPNVCTRCHEDGADFVRAFPLP
ncbi:MAG: hypothetical protein HY908_32080 [Myxococcales bacterium]|nr:hypothetical protein [Myxococcales bacterium]